MPNATTSRSATQQVEALRVGAKRLRATIDGCTAPTDAGLTVGPMYAARALSNATQDLAERALRIVEYSLGTDDVLRPGEVRDDFLIRQARIGAGGLDAALAQSISLVMGVVAHPIERHNEQNASEPGVAHDRWLTGDVITYEAVRALEQAIALMELVADEDEPDGSGDAAAQLERDLQYQSDLATFSVFTRERADQVHAVGASITSEVEELIEAANAKTRASVLDDRNAIRVAHECVLSRDPVPLPTGKEEFLPRSDMRMAGFETALEAYRAKHDDLADRDPVEAYAWGRAWMLHKVAARNGETIDGTAREVLADLDPNSDAGYARAPYILSQLLGDMLHDESSRPFGVEASIRFAILCSLTDNEDVEPEQLGVSLDLPRGGWEGAGGDTFGHREGMRAYVHLEEPEGQPNPALRRRLTERARLAAHRLGLELESGGSSVDAVPTLAVEDRRRFELVGNVYEIEFGLETVKLKKSVGLDRLHLLLRQPGVGISVVELMGCGSVAGSDKVFDSDAAKHYRSRIKEIQEERVGLDDPAAIAALNEESEQLEHELATGTGFGGRTRLLGDEIKRLSSRLGKSITRAIESIRESGAPSAAAHLEDSIVTPSGATPAYRPAETTIWVT